MKFSSSRRGAVLAAAAVPFAASAAWCGGTKGSGDVVHHEVDPGEFDSIEVAGDLEVVLRQARPQRVTIDTDDNILPLIEARVKGRTLRLRATETITPTRLAIAVDTWVLNRIGVAGGGRVSSSKLVSKELAAGVAGSARLRLDDLTAESLTLRAAGSGSVHVGGRANELEAAVAGSGLIVASTLEVRRATVKVAGSGQAEVWALDTLDGAVAGSGGLRYRGDPQVSVERAGSGTVGRKT